MDYTYYRNKDVISGLEDLENLYTIKNFPVFMGSTNESAEFDKFADLNFQISKSTGMVQINPLVDLSIVYKSTHSPGMIGKTWKNHHKALSDFLLKFGRNLVLEIGGYSGVLANNCLSKNNNIDWTIIDPHAEQFDKNIKVINSFFDSSYLSQNKFDLIVHSHLLEHIIDINSFFQICYDNLNEDGFMVFSLPNFDLFHKKRITNCLHFEHTMFLDEYFLSKLFMMNKFEIVEKQYYDQCCSIFYCLKKSSIDCEVKFDLFFDYYKNKFIEYFNDINRFIEETNFKIENESNVFLFGGHVTSQYLISMGLKESKIKFILDNDPKKQESRLYGTNIMIKSPDILSDYKDPVLILKNSSFDDEIMAQVLNINKNLRVLTF